MAEIASVKPYALTIPDDGSYYQPKLQLPNWKPEDFIAAYQYGPKPVPINEYSGISNGIGELAQQFTPQARLANEQARDRLADYNGSTPTLAPMNGFQGGTISSNAVGNASDGSVPNLVPASLASAATPAVAAPVLVPPTPSTDQTADRSVSNVSAPDADGVFSTTGTVFAGPKDRAAYDRAKASGATELQALAVGDNGIGAGGANTSDPTKNYVAASPAFMAANNLKLGDPLTVSANGKTTTAFIGDHLPNDSKNGSGLDLNPGTAASLGVDPDNFKGQVSFRIGANTVPTARAAINSTADLPADPGPVSASPLFGYQPNVAPAGSGRQQTSTTVLAPATDTSAANSVVNQPMVPIGDKPVLRAAPLLVPVSQNASATAPDPGTPLIAPMGNTQPSRQGMSGPLLMPPGNTALTSGEMNYVLAPPAPESFLAKEARMLGPGTASQNADGSVVYKGTPQLTPTEQQTALANLKFKQGEADRDEARAANEIRMANRRPTATTTVVGADGIAQTVLYHTDDGSLVSTIGAKPVVAGKGGAGLPKAIITDAVRYNVPTEGKTADEVAQEIEDKQTATGIIPPSQRQAAETLQKMVVANWLLISGLSV